MSSQLGLVSIPGKAVYSAVKSGLIGLTKVRIYPVLALVLYVALL